jgi:hypothetical protein
MHQQLRRRPGLPAHKRLTIAVVSTVSIDANRTGENVSQVIFQRIAKRLARSDPVASRDRTPPPCGISAPEMAAGTESHRRLLGRILVVEELSPEDLLHVAEVAIPRRFEPHEVVFREGDDSDT